MTRSRSLAKAPRARSGYSRADRDSCDPFLHEKAAMPMITTWYSRLNPRSLREAPPVVLASSFMWKKKKNINRLVSFITMKQHGPGNKD